MFNLEMTAAEQLADADIAPTALLLADSGRIAMLWALSDGRALPAGELAAAGRVQPSTASEHLAKLEALAVASRPLIALSPREAHTAQRLRLARSCYDHIAGALGVGLTNAMITLGTLRLAGRDYHITDGGAGRLRALGLDPEAMTLLASRRRRPLARACLDWSERRYHVAGVLGAALLSRLLEVQWIERVAAGRALRVTAIGRRALRQEFGLVVDVEVR